MRTALISVLAALGLAAQAQAAGYVDLPITAPHHAAPLQGGVWYPDDGAGPAALLDDRPVFYGTPVRRDAPLRDGAYPLIVLSHGMGGLFLSLSWLAATLADNGAVVVAANHPGSTFGDFEMDRAMRHWTRAQDLTAAIDTVRADPFFAAAVRDTPVYATGFSYGGWTALSLAGARANLAGYRHACDTGVGGRHCEDMARQGVNLADLDAAPWDASYRDPRVTAVAAIDPALLHGVTREDVADISADVLLIGLGAGDDRLQDSNFDADGADVLQKLPAATALTIAPATHFSALGLCKPAGAALLVEEGDDPVCDDPAHADRAVIHAAIAAAISRHFGLGD